MKKKNLIIIIIIIITILLIIAGIVYYPKYTRQEFLDYIQNIEYDVKITKITKVLFTQDTGAYDVNYKLVNLENRKLYSIYYGGFLGHDIDRYSIREKNLTHGQIEQISTLSEMETEDIDKMGSFNQNEVNQNNRTDSKYYWEIIYNGKEIELNELPFSEKILDY